jgi:DnaA family protein
MRVPEEVIVYLLTHVRRDLHTLTAILDELDRNSLERQRQITLPLVKDILKALEE